MSASLLQPVYMLVDFQAGVKGSCCDEEPEQVMDVVHQEPRYFVVAFRGKEGETERKPSDEAPPTMCLICRLASLSKWQPLSDIRCELIAWLGSCFKWDRVEEEINCAMLTALVPLSVERRSRRKCERELAFEFEDCVERILCVEGTPSCEVDQVCGVIQFYAVA